MTFSYEIRNELCISDLVKLLEQEITELAAMLYRVQCPTFLPSGLDQLAEYSSNCVPNTEDFFEHFSTKFAFENQRRYSTRPSQAVQISTGVY